MINIKHISLTRKYPVGFFNAGYSDIYAPIDWPSLEICAFKRVPAVRAQFSSTSDQGSLQLRSQFKLSSTDAGLSVWFSTIY